MIIRNDEKAIFALRELYSRYGYTQFRMRKFEEYDFYVRNKDFLISDSVITFTDTDGKLMALKPDVTLSIIKNTRDTSGVQKLYYNENVYRVSNSTHAFKEIMQVGLECIGEVDDTCIAEVLMLAVESLRCISDEALLDISHMGIISEILDASGASFDARRSILRCIGEKNAHELAAICRAEGFGERASALLEKLCVIRGEPDTLFRVLRTCGAGLVSEESVGELEKAVAALRELGCGDMINVDFSVVNDMNYYNGIVFKGFIRGIPTGVLSGGQYDKLMKKIGRKASAIGFAVYLDALERMEEREDSDEPRRMLNIALPKGRLGERVYDMFEAAGFGCPSIREGGRKLIFENPECGVRFFWVKPSDISIYVERGAADIGVAGKDILLEYEPDIYELLDLNIGKCRMAVAAPRGFTDDTQKTLRVATKFANIARSYYAELGRDIDIIHLNGSIEIAPILGLSDVIVDIVETGKTLKENDLMVYDEVMPISARLIANKSSGKFCGGLIEKITEALAAQREVTE
ncbi:MAG: ATP phosphoribosyltransferase [Oscillospiraceae bacterium]|nr:ATP phosphoribosyltransferase [Oscillospiraceae bacterium]